MATDGADAAGCGSVSSPCATLQFAYDSASNGDALFVAPGIYREYVQMRRRSVAVSVFGSGARETVIDGRGLGAALVIDLDFTATVEGADLTLKGSPYGALTVH